MNIFSSIKYKCYLHKEAKTYKKFKSCNLPYPFYDGKRNTFEWVYFDKGLNEFYVKSELSDILPQGGLIYYFETLDYNKETKKYELVESHAHSFNEVLHRLYDFPESFNIKKEFKDYYSKQELDYIKKNQNYLKLIDLKDYRESDELKKLNSKWDQIDKKKHKSISDRWFLFRYHDKWEYLRHQEDLERYCNSKHEEYSSYYYRRYSDDIIAAIINGEKKNIIHGHNKPMVGKRVLLSDDEYNYKCVIEFTKDNFIKFKDLKQELVYIPKKYKDFKNYKKYLKESFIQDRSYFEDEFNDDSLINIAEFKIIEKF